MGRCSVRRDNGCNHNGRRKYTAAAAPFFTLLDLDQLRQDDRLLVLLFGAVSATCLAVKIQGSLPGESTGAF